MQTLLKWILTAMYYSFYLLNFVSTLDKLFSRNYKAIPSDKTVLWNSNLKTFRGHESCEFIEISKTIHSIFCQAQQPLPRMYLWIYSSPLRPFGFIFFMPSKPYTVAVSISLPLMKFKTVVILLVDALQTTSCFLMFHVLFIICF